MNDNDKTGVALLRAVRESPDDKGRALVAADHFLSIGRFDVAAMLRPELIPQAWPRAEKRRKRIEKMTTAERAQMPAWAEKWIRVGLSTEPADRPLFEAAVAQCYIVAGLQPPKTVVWCPSPVVVAYAGPIAHAWLARAKRGRGASVEASVRASVGDSVEAPGVLMAPGNEWWRILGGQFWGGGWYWWGSPSYVSFFLDAMRLDLGDEMELRARAYGATASSACWWWPHRDYVLVSERPHTLEKRDGKLWRVEWDGWGCGPGYIQQKEAA